MKKRRYQTCEVCAHHIRERATVVRTGESLELSWCAHRKEYTVQPIGSAWKPQPPCNGYKPVPELVEKEIRSARETCKTARGYLKAQEAVLRQLQELLDDLTHTEVLKPASADGFEETEGHQ